MRRRFGLKAFNANHSPPGPAVHLEEDHFVQCQRNSWEVFAAGLELCNQVAELDGAVRFVVDLVDTGTGSLERSYRKSVVRNCSRYELDNSSENALGSAMEGTTAIPRYRTGWIEGVVNVDKMC